MVGGLNSEKRNIYQDNCFVKKSPPTALSDVVLNCSEYFSEQFIVNQYTRSLFSSSFASSHCFQQSNYRSMPRLCQKMEVLFHLLESL
jgi:hypothetical protein